MSIFMKNVKQLEIIYAGTSSLLKRKRCIVIRNIVKEFKNIPKEKENILIKRFLHDAFKQENGKLFCNYWIVVRVRLEVP